MTSTTATFEKTISYDRDAREFKAELDGNYIGHFSSYHAAEVALDQVAYDLLMDGQCATATALDAGSSAHEIAADLTAPEPAPGECEAYLCHNPAVHVVATSPDAVTFVCCEHYPDITGETCYCTLVIRAEAPAQLAARVEEPSVLFCEIEGCDNDPVMLDPFPICAGHLSDPDYGAAHAPSRCVGFIPGQCGNVAQPGEPFCPECAAGLDRVVVAAYIQRLADDAGRCVFCAGDHLSADCRLRKPLVVPAPTTCGNCGAAHSIQRCPAVWQALRAA